ncbi:glycosyltransferase family 87 protein [Cupriavidus necator]|nr:glycosyltransferase family 87 protein [Cupriavidus necator]
MQFFGSILPIVGSILTMHFVCRWPLGKNEANIYQGMAAALFRRTWVDDVAGQWRQWGEWGEMSIDHSPEATPETETSRHWLDLDRIRVYSIAMLIAYVGMVLLWCLRTKGFTTDSLARPGVDFSAFWSASFLALQGHAAKVYDYETLSPVIAAFGAVKGGEEFYLPWAYPPMFLLLVMPLALLPFAASYLIFVGVTAAIYIAAIISVLNVRSLPGHAGWLPVLAFPGIHEAAFMGQNSLLTAGLAAWGLIQTRDRPAMAGVLIGLLCIKPQLALMFPVALVAGRAWKTLLTAAVTAAAMAACSVAAFGWETIPAFLGASTLFKARVLEQGSSAWPFCPSIFSMMRMAGASVMASYCGQGVCAAFALAGVAKVWSGQNSMALRTSVVAASTLLASPYLWYYDLTWLGIAIAGVAIDGVRRGWLKGERELLAVAWLLPLLLSINRLVDMPQLGPLVTLLLMTMVLRRARWSGSLG